MGEHRTPSLRLTVAAPFLVVLLVAVPGFVVYDLVRESAGILLSAVREGGDGSLLVRTEAALEGLLSRVSLVFASASVLAVAGAIVAAASLAGALRRLSEWAAGFRKGRPPALDEEGPTELAHLCRRLNRLGSEVGEELSRLGASEDRFRDLIEGMSEGMVVVDRRDRITFANRRFADILGRSVETLTGKEISRLLDPPNREKVRRETARRRRGEPGRYELTWTRRDGERVVTLVSATPLLGRKGRFEGSFAVISDVTERRKLEEQMGRAEKFRALGEMAGGIAHELNNRLTAILGNAQLLLLEIEDERIAPGLRVIEQATMDGAETVRRILEFARGSSGAEREEADVGLLVDEVCNLLPYRRKDGEPTAVHRILRDYRATRSVQCNPSETREAFLNLLTNAFDSMPGGGELRITTFDHPDGVGVRIADTGHGMSKATAKRAFDPFFTTRGVGRTGLGLSVAYGIVERHGGRISLRSEVGRGTTVTLLLPGSRPLPERTRPEEEAREAAPSAARLLVVDDERGVARMLQLAFTRQGLRADAARSGEEALALLETGREYEVLLTDLSMPGMSGLALASRAKRIRPDLSVVLVTGWGPETEELAAGPDGPVDLTIRKPFSLPDLMDGVQRLLARPAPEAPAAPGAQKTSRK